MTLIEDSRESEIECENHSFAPSTQDSEQADFGDVCIDEDCYDIFQKGISCEESCSDNGIRSEARRLNLSITAIFEIHASRSLERTWAASKILVRASPEFEGSQSDFDELL